VACIALVFEEVVQAASKNSLTVLFENRFKIFFHHFPKPIEGLNHEPMADLQTSAARFQA
tara:strand:+ start:13121 stop:13300 length:180 start_codon:yes stop_codon:yes gene_type:complete